eukprot:526382-Hanusia_phi.AAC.1
MEAGAGLVSRRRGRGRARAAARRYPTWNHGVPAYRTPRWGHGRRRAGFESLSHEFSGPRRRPRLGDCKSAGGRNLLYTSKCVPAAGCSEPRGLLRGGRMA